MMLVDLLSEGYAAEFDESWERERTANTLIKQSGTEYIGWLTAF